MQKCKIVNLPAFEDWDTGEEDDLENWTQLKNAQAAGEAVEVIEIACEVSKDPTDNYYIVKCQNGYIVDNVSGYCLQGIVAL